MKTDSALLKDFCIPDRCTLSGGRLPFQSSLNGPEHQNLVKGGETSHVEPWQPKEITVSSSLRSNPKWLRWESVYAFVRQPLNRLIRLKQRRQRGGRNKFTHLAGSLSLSPGYMYSEWAGILQRQVKSDFEKAGFRGIQLTLTPLDRSSVLPLEDNGIPGTEIAILTFWALDLPHAESKESPYYPPTELTNWVHSGAIFPVYVSSESEDQPLNPS